MPVKTLSTHLSTRGAADIHDFTERVAGNVARSEPKDGTLTVFCPSHA